MHSCEENVPDWIKDGCSLGSARIASAHLKLDRSTHSSAYLHDHGVSKLCLNWQGKKQGAGPSNAAHSSTILEVQRLGATKFSTAGLDGRIIVWDV